MSGTKARDILHAIKDGGKNITMEGEGAVKKWFTKYVYLCTTKQNEKLWSLRDRGTEIKAKGPECYTYHNKCDEGL